MAIEDVLLPFSWETYEVTNGEEAEYAGVDAPGWYVRWVSRHDGNDTGELDGPHPDEAAADARGSQLARERTNEIWGD